MAVNQQQLEKQGIYEAKASLPSLLGDLEEIGNLAGTVAARQRGKAKTGGWTILAGVIGSIAGATTGLSWLLWLSLLAMVFGIGYWITSFFGGGKLTEHRTRLEIARQRLLMLQQDAAEQTPFSLRLALSCSPTQLSDEPWKGRRNGKEQCFEENWLLLEGRLLDGTVVTDEIKDLTRKRTFSNARGKRKSKSRVTHLVNVRFTYPHETYGDAREAEKALRDKVKVGSAAVLRSVRVTEKAVAMKAMVKVEKEIAPTTVTLSISAYRILNLARRMAAGPQGNRE